MTQFETNLRNLKANLEAEKESYKQERWSISAGTGKALQRRYYRIAKKERRGLSAKRRRTENRVGERN